MTSARDRILDAYEELLAREGERYATLDAVAAKAGVSKGGLLYHFPAKDQLSDGLCERLISLAAEDVDEMRTAAEGPARYYVRTSRYEGTALDRVLVAVSRLQQAGNPRARAVMEVVSDTWLAILHDTLGDLAMARAIKLIGDGLYYNALSRALAGTPDPATGDEELLAVIDRITRNSAT
ncbi:MAG: TetR/AcrR family transcriptional regulator [Mycolicibacterium cosmeticum]|nr:TetR/AcrR family transcriptional regulator [Mycolicibacterium cosmeticum]